MKSRKCPKCKHPPITYREQWKAHGEIEWDADGNGIPTKNKTGDAYNHGGDPYGVIAECI